MLPVRISAGTREFGLDEQPVPLPIDRLVPGPGEWQVELGFGKGRYLLQQAAQTPQARFLGIEVASAYFRLVQERARRRGLRNLLLLRGEALYVLATVLPASFASAVHVYFPDPWPKARHQKRRLFDLETIDLVVGLLRPSGVLYFATDHLDYGFSVREILQSHPAIDVTWRDSVWGDGARTNYEAKYEREGRPIVRLEAKRVADPSRSLLHPSGRAGVLAAPARRAEM